MRHLIAALLLLVPSVLLAADVPSEPASSGVFSLPRYPEAAQLVAPQLQRSLGTISTRVEMETPDSIEKVEKFYRVAARKLRQRPLEVTHDGAVTILHFNEEESSEQLRLERRNDRTHIQQVRTSYLRKK